MGIYRYLDMADGGASDGSSHFNLNPLYISSASKAGKDCKTIDSPTPALATVEPVVLRGAKLRCSYSVAILLISIEVLMLYSSLLDIYLIFDTDVETMYVCNNRMLFQGRMAFPSSKHLKNMKRRET